MKDEGLAYEDEDVFNEKNHINTFIKLKELELSNFDLHEDISGFTNYDWKSLEKSIKEHGILEPLHVIPIPHTKKYKIKDGNHRMYILKKLYPSTYKVKVKVF
tara:strand:+ start:1941 stop:2249 length:309 start_codon:yes stop_codon:yes gene_type:complete